MRLTSTFVPGHGSGDVSFSDMQQNEGTYGLNNDDPAFVVLSGIVFARDLSTGDLGPVLTGPQSPDDRFFHLINGVLTITLEV